MAGSGSRVSKEQVVRAEPYPKCLDSSNVYRALFSRTRVWCKHYYIKRNACKHYYNHIICVETYVGLFWLGTIAHTQPLFDFRTAGSSFDVVVLPLHRYGGTKAVVVYPVFLRLNALAFIFYLGCTTASRTRVAFIRGRRLIVLCLVETLKE